MKVWALEGNIASGKSTLISKIQDLCANVHCILEPVEKYCQLEGYNPLQLAYYEPKVYSFLNQAHILQSQWRYYKKRLNDIKSTPYIKMLESDPDEPVILFDRSFISDIVFVETLRDLGYISAVEKTELRLMINNMLYDLFGQQELHRCFERVLYVDCPPEKCIVRLFERKRKEEIYMQNPLRYLETIHNNYVLTLATYKELGGTIINIPETLHSSEFLSKLFSEPSLHPTTAISLKFN
jgi:deoxyadenosine/deoxycytidine kinase